MTLYLLTNDGPLVIASAVLLDLAIGDPESFPHPVRVMGAAINRLEPALRRMPVPETAQGAILACLLTIAAYLLTALLLAACFHVSDMAGRIASVVLIFQAVSIRCLADEAIGVKRALEDGIEKARLRLSRIVGRDTADLDEGGICMAAVESVAENFVDGVVSPLFFAAIGGPPLAMAFKAVSTLDSMVGYRNDRYRRFGTWGARMDDVANFLPARLSVFVIALSAATIGLSPPGPVLRGARGDGKGHESPNSGLPEAAFAAALGVRLAGPVRYGGKLRVRPYMNAQGGPCRASDISRSVRLLVASSILFAGGAITASIALRAWFLS